MRYDFLPDGEMTVEEVTSRYLPAYGNSWQEWFKQASESPSRRVLEAIHEDYLKSGGLHRPVILSEAYTEIDEETGATETIPAGVNDGMHRIAAAHLFNIPSVPYKVGYPKNRAPVDYILTLTLGGPAEVFLWEDKDGGDDFYTVLRESLSFPSQSQPKPHWVQMEGGAGPSDYEGSTTFSAWLATPDSIHPRDLNLIGLHEEVEERLKAFGIPVRVVGVFIEEYYNNLEEGPDTYSEEEAWEILDKHFSNGSEDVK